MFNDAYKNKRVLVTGHTGFKGGWLTSWLLKLGAEVVGFSKDIPTHPAMFDELNLSQHMRHLIADVRDLNTVRKVIEEEKPDFVFHLAAQAIVSVSYQNPVETMTTNAMGTMNILEALRFAQKPCVAIMVTSDKCYDNLEWPWGYRETDALGGRDVYSGSKGAAELVIKSYLYSFFTKNHPVRIGVGRAGNVIGGGDWAKDRIVVDCMRAWSESKTVEIRSPQSTRPWQHVLEPISGYLTLGHALLQDHALHGETFNFGPRAEQNRTVVELLSDLGRHWGFKSSQEAYQITDNIPFHEAGLLKLNCDKALLKLKWEPNLNYDDTIRMIGDWYKAYYKHNADMYAHTMDQISFYEKEGVSKKLVWTKSHK
ncbi:CDP-glucose 4,6-dehydratase [bacterium]|nr:CDP-glucose 4,6-dehydratase [bacterium]